MLEGSKNIKIIKELIAFIEPIELIEKSELTMVNVFRHILLGVHKLNARGFSSVI